jgi:hypothetical protein
MEIRFTCPAYVTKKSNTDGPQLRLSILDSRTHFILCSFTEHMERAILQGNRDRNFNLAMGVLMNDVVTLSSRPVPLRTVSDGGVQAGRILRVNFHSDGRTRTRNDPSPSLSVSKLLRLTSAFL